MAGEVMRVLKRVMRSGWPGNQVEMRWRIGENEGRFQLVDADANMTGAKPHLNYGIVEWN